MISCDFNEGDQGKTMITFLKECYCKCQDFKMGH